MVLAIVRHVCYSGAMTDSRRRLLKAKIALSLRTVYGKTPSTEEIEKYAKLAEVLFVAIGGAFAMRSEQKRTGQISLWG